jgi:nucleoid DNA-binding protein
MQDYLQKYLAHHNNVTITGLGEFKVVKNVPEWQAVQQQLAAPATEILWSKSTEPTTQGFIDYIATSKNISTTTTIDFITNEIAIMKSLIEKEGFDEWVGFGIFKNDALQKIIFSPNEPIRYSKMVLAEKVIRKNEVHTMTVGEQETTNTAMEAFYSEPEKRSFKWWWWPIIIGTLSLAYIIYYYFG